MAMKNVAWGLTSFDQFILTTDEGGRYARQPEMEVVLWPLPV